MTAYDAVDQAGLWQGALAADDLWEGDLVPVEVAGEPIVLARLAGGDIRAYQGRCPHQGMALSGGEFDGRYLTCSAHAWKFDLLTGQGVNPAGCALARFPVSVRAEQILVKLAQGPGARR
jgi:toluene monooxygenase system ferredoxin subunit